jgi:hypothetical protein
MAQLTTATGRMGVGHPNLGYDTADGGVALHNALHTMFKAFSDHIGTRWYTCENIAIAGTVNIVHNMNAPLSKLGIRIRVGTSFLTQEEAAIQYPATEISANEIQITNSSGGISTFEVYMTDAVPKDLGKPSETDMKTVFGFGRIVSPTQAAIAAGNYTFDASLQHVFLKTGGAGTFTISNLKEGQTINIMVASTGSAYTITWSPAIKWAGGSAPIPTVASARYDFYTFVMVGGIIVGSCVRDMY